MLNKIKQYWWLILLIGLVAGIYFIVNAYIMHEAYTHPQIKSQSRSHIKTTIIKTTVTNVKIEGGDLKLLPDGSLELIGGKAEVTKKEEEITKKEENTENKAESTIITPKNNATVALICINYCLNGTYEVELFKPLINVFGVDFNIGVGYTINGLDPKNLKVGIMAIF